MSGRVSSPRDRAREDSHHEPLAARVDELLELRTRASERYFEEVADPLARLCHRAAERFSRGGRLLAVAHTPQARSDARHVAVEFVHPVIVGKRALPALALTGDGEALRERVELTAEPADIAIAFGSRRGDSRGARRGWEARRPDRGLRADRRRVGARACGQPTRSCARS